jgi:hypothetical protein
MAAKGEVIAEKYARLKERHLVEVCWWGGGGKVGGREGLGESHEGSTFFPSNAQITKARKLQQAVALKERLIVSLRTENTSRKCP